MPDREKVAKDLADIGAWIAGRIGFEMARNFMRTIDDAVALIKEQEDLGTELTNAMELIHKKNKRIENLENLLKEQEGFLGIQQTANSITFVSTGTAQQGEARGLLLGKLTMHEWLKKELLYRGLLTDNIRAVFDEAERWGGR